MSNYIVQGETLTALGDAIRAKTGNSQLLTLADMTTVVNSDLRPMGFPDKMDLVYPNISLNSYALSTAIFGDGIWFTGAGNDVYISYDGFTWSHFTVDVSLGYVARAYANGVWVNGDTETGALYYSTDRLQVVSSYQRGYLHFHQNRSLFQQLNLLEQGYIFFHHLNNGLKRY